MIQTFMSRLTLLKQLEISFSNFKYSLIIRILSYILNGCRRSWLQVHGRLHHKVKIVAIAYILKLKIGLLRKRLKGIMILILKNLLACCSLVILRFLHNFVNIVLYFKLNVMVDFEKR